MSELRKANSEHPYFVTLTVVGWVDLFTRKEYCDVIFDSLNFCSQNKGLKLSAYVIMPSHIHMIIRNQKSKLPSILRDFKSFTAKQILHMIETESFESRKEWLLHIFKYNAAFRNQNSHYMLWQKTNHPIDLTNSKIYDQKLDYIHENPVAAGLVTDAESWVYSSATKYTQLRAKLVE
jgi:putative transposase